MVVLKNHKISPLKIINPFYSKQPNLLQLVIDNSKSTCTDTVVTLPIIILYSYTSLNPIKKGFSK